MKLDEDYKKVMNELQKNFGWSNIDVLPESYQDLLNDTIKAVKNLTIQRIINCANCEHGKRKNYQIYCKGCISYSNHSKRYL